MNDFQAFSLQVARSNEIEALLPVVEKELIHYEILQALGESKWLGRLNFQGGTCLRLCYGSERYSEDLDFTTKEDLSETDLGGFRDLWDIPWILHQPQVDLSAVPDLTLRKIRDYASGKSPRALLEDGARRAVECVQSDAFVAQMARFLLPTVWERTANRPAFLAVMARELDEGYRGVISHIS
ncbi:hypothetical protein GMI70_01815 [Eggerthellaceae bacterium zg-893]|nr:hypothetical protein [Eggerthellaceae bacterium zg-893]